MPPETLPDLSDAKVIGFDLETYDPKLKTTNPYKWKNLDTKKLF